LDLDLQLDDPPAQLGIDLVRHEGVVQDLELAGDERLELVGLPARRFDCPERVGVAEQLASLQLDALPARRRLGRCTGARLPPCLGQRGLEWSELALQKGDETIRVRHDRGVYGRAS